MNQTAQSDATRQHVERLRLLASQIEAEANGFEAEMNQPFRQDTDPAPESVRTALVSRLAGESRDLLTLAMRGAFSCVFCAAQGPHRNVTVGSRVAFACGSCAGPLGALEIKLAVFATLARVAAEERT